VIVTSTIARLERFDRVGSTNDVVSDWLADGEPEVCVAVANEQTAGRGRSGRTWTAPPGAALLLSLGFRPSWLAPDRAWQLAATVSLAMAEAAEAASALPDGTIRLKWPNDLVAATGGSVRKVAGVLGETDGLGTADPRVVVGIGINVDWPEAAFPRDLAPTMTSLRVLRGGPVDRESLLVTFLGILEARVGRLRDGRAFDARSWAGRQVTTGRAIELHESAGSVRAVIATGVDPESGALRVRDTSTGAEAAVLVGEIRHVRLAAV